ncbi:transposase [Propioniciclava soli]|uniref:Transposase n=1 Tax=Propioniciclava soli TaxID=2775081 RepID=A0ABZ3CAJ7_9ACTN
MHTKTGYGQCYNAQVAVTASQVIVAAIAAQEPTDVWLLDPVTRRALDCYQQATGHTPTTPVVLADAGYYSADNAALSHITPIIPAGKRRDNTAEKLAARAADGQHAEDVLNRYEKNELTAIQAADLLGTTVYGVISRAYRRRKRLRVGSSNEQLMEMNQRIATDTGRALYKKRSGMVEPVFAQLKHNRGITRFVRRGHHAAQTELTLFALTANLLKVFHTQPATC